MGFQNLSREWVSGRGSHLFTKSPFSFLPPSAQCTEWDNASWPLWTLCGLALVPITSALKVEWTANTTGFWAEPQNQLYPPQLQTLLCESSPGGPGDLGLRAWPSLDTAWCFLFGSRRTQSLLELPLNIHEITVCGLDESRDFSHLWENTQSMWKSCKAHFKHKCLFFHSFPWQTFTEHLWPSLLLSCFLHSNHTGPVAVSRTNQAPPCLEECALPDPGPRTLLTRYLLG